MPCFYFTPKQDDFNKIPELQICIAEALYALLLLGDRVSGKYCTQAEVL